MRLLYLFSLFLVFACSNEPVKENALESSEEKFTGTLEIEYAEHFQLERTNKGYLLHILNPDTQKKEQSFEIIQGKSRRIISLTSTLNGMVSILGAVDQLKGISDINYVYDPAIKKRYKNEQILAYGDESSHSLEKLIASGANTLLFSGFGDEFPNSTQLKKLGFDIIPIYDWRETHPLGKAEWIKLVGVLTGKETEAMAFFEEVKSSYFETKALVANVEKRPTVVSGNLLNDIWYAPAGESYMALLLKDAGASYTHAKESGTGSNEFSIEEILKADQNTEFWINPGIGTKRQIDKMNPHAKHLRAYENIYCYSPEMNKFWERSAAEPHLMLSDLIHLFHPEIREIKSFHFYSKID